MPTKPLRCLRIKLFTPGNRSHKTCVVKAKGGHHFTDEGEEIILKRYADEIEKAWPCDEFSLKEVGRGEYSFVWIGKRPIDEAALLVGGMPLGQVAQVEVGQQELCS